MKGVLQMDAYFGRGKHTVKNFILMGKDQEELKRRAQDIADEAERLFPESFSGDKNIFPFEVRYTPPFDKCFTELKRLQGTAAGNAGYRSEYKGYIMIDMNSFLRHETENYTDITLKFLCDSNDAWSYIFIVDTTRTKAAMELVRKILSLLRCRVIDCTEICGVSENRFIVQMCETYGLECSRSLQSFLAQAIAQEKISKEAAETVLLDMVQICGSSERATIQTLYACIRCDSSTIKYMLSEEKMKELTVLCSDAMRKENSNEKI